MGIHRTRANVETAPLLHKLEYHHGVFVPPASYFDSTPLPPEWLQALPHLNRPPSPIRSPPLLDRPSTASPAWPARSPSPGVRDGTRNPHGGFGETKDSRPAVTTGRGTAGGGGGGDDGASSGYSDYSDVFEDDAKSPQRSARHASPAAITSPPLHPPTRPAFGTVWQVRVQVHAIHGLRTQPEQTCRVVCEIFEEVMSNESLPVGRSAVARTSRRDQAVGDASSGNGASPGHSLNDSTSTFPLGSSVGSASVDILASLGFAVRRKAPGSTVGSRRGGPDAGPVQPETEATMFVFNSTSTQRLLARATDLRTFLKQAHSLLMEIIVSTPPPAKPSKVSLLREHGSTPRRTLITGARLACLHRNTLRRRPARAARRGIRTRSTAARPIRRRTSRRCSGTCARSAWSHCRARQWSTAPSKCAVPMVNPYVSVWGVGAHTCNHGGVDSRGCAACGAQVSSASGEPVYISVSVFLSAEAVASAKAPLPDHYKVGDTLGNRVVAVTVEEGGAPGSVSQYVAF